MSNLPAEIKQYSAVPLKAIPKQTLERFQVPFMGYLSLLLNLKSDNAENLEMCVPVILEMNRQYNFTQLHEMFTLYVDGKLNVEPISNYIDRILISKIRNGYIDYLKKANRDIKKAKKVDKNGHELTEQDSYKREQDIIYACEWFDSYCHTDKMDNDMVWLYSFLEFELIINYSADEKKAIYKEMIDQGMNKEDAIRDSKLQLLQQYFDFLRRQKLHLNSVLKF